LGAQNVILHAGVYRHTTFMEITALRQVLTWMHLPRQPA
jgi:hypothetical protein